MKNVGAVQNDYELVLLLALRQKTSVRKEQESADIALFVKRNHAVLMLSSTSKEVTWREIQYKVKEEEGTRSIKHEKIKTLAIFSKGTLVAIFRSL